jgi:hypothetical protein
MLSQLAARDWVELTSFSMADCDELTSFRCHGCGWEAIECTRGGGMGLPCLRQRSVMHAGQRPRGCRVCGRGVAAAHAMLAETAKGLPRMRARGCCRACHARGKGLSRTRGSGPMGCRVCDRGAAATHAMLAARVCRACGAAAKGLPRTRVRGCCRACHARGKGLSRTRGSGQGAVAYASEGLLPRVRCSRQGFVAHAGQRQRPRGCRVCERGAAAADAVLAARVCRACGAATAAKGLLPRMPCSRQGSVARVGQRPRGCLACGRGAAAYVARVCCACGAAAAAKGLLPRMRCLRQGSIVPAVQRPRGCRVRGRGAAAAYAGEGLLPRMRRSWQGSVAHAGQRQRQRPRGCCRACDAHGKGPSRASGSGQGAAAYEGERLLSHMRDKGLSRHGAVGMHVSRDCRGNWPRHKRGYQGKRGAIKASGHGASLLSPWPRTWVARADAAKAGGTR